MDLYSRKSVGAKSNSNYAAVKEEEMVKSVARGARFMDKMHERLDPIAKKEILGHILENILGSKER